MIVWIPNYDQLEYLYLPGTSWNVKMFTGPTQCYVHIVLNCVAYYILFKLAFCFNFSFVHAILRNFILSSTGIKKE